jgi:hypothetical protein
MPRHLAASAVVLVLVACGGDDERRIDAAAVSDAATLSDGATPPIVDASPNASDAPDAPPPADAGPCAPSLAPIGDNFDVVVSEIKVGAYIELFNTTAAPVDLSTYLTHQWCAFPSYRSVAVAITVPAGGYATVPWPGVTVPTDAAGELVFYVDMNFINPASVLSYVCWGTGGSLRKDTAENASRWAGPCVAAIPDGGSLHRKIGTLGTNATDYETSAINTPMNCVPE